jgi:hypothetical protein
MLVLVVAAVDVSALLMLAGSVVQDPFVALLLKAIPAIFGVTLAAYVERVGRFVRTVADRGWFQVVVAAAAFGVALPQFWTYELPLVVPEWAKVALDSVPVVPRDTVLLLRVHGFREHTLSVQEFDAVTGGPRTDSYSFGPPQLLRAGLRTLHIPSFSAFRLRVGILRSLTIEHPTVARQIEVRGTFPDLFLRGVRLKDPVSAPDPAGERSIVFLELRPRNQTTLELPPGTGPYRVRFYSSAHCWSDGDTVTVARGADAHLDLSKQTCSEAPKSP